MIKLSRKVLCLDWDKRSLRVVAARVGGGGMTLEDAHSHRLPSALDADDPQAMGDFIQQTLRRHRLRARTVVVDVPRERAVINRLTLPPTPESEIAAAVRFQAMRELPFPLETAAADYVITRRDEKGMVTEALLAAVTLETLDRVRATCQAAGLAPARIGLRPYANLVSVQQVVDLGDRHVLFVDVGPGATEIDVFRGPGLAFARSANVSIPVPTGAPGTPGDSRIISLAEIADLENSSEAIGAAVEELLVEVSRTLQAYRASEPDVVLSRVVVAGGTGIESQLSEALERRLGYPVQLFDPTGPLGVEASEAAKLRSFSAALGLAWGLRREGMLGLDFLNPKRPVSSRETFQRRARMGMVAVAVVAAVVAVVLGRAYFDLSGQRDALRSANSKLRTELDRKTGVRNFVERADEWQLQAVWPDELLALTEAAIDPGKKMLVQGIELEGSLRTQRITLRNVHASDWPVPFDFVRTLNELSSDGEPVYEATPLRWTEVHNIPDFKGKVDIQIELHRLAREVEDAAKRDKARKAGVAGK